MRGFATAALLSVCVLAPAAGPSAAAPQHGFVVVIGSGLPGRGHDDKGPHPAILGQALQWSAISISSGVTGDLDPEPLAIPGCKLVSGIGRDITEEQVRRLNDIGVRYFIFENEPDGSNDPDWPKNHTEALCRTYQLIHSVSDDNVVIGGNLMFADFDKLYEYGFRDCCDVVGLHNYSNDPATGMDTSMVVEARAQLETAGDADKLIFLGEGWGPQRQLPGLTRLSPDIPPSAAEIRMLRRFVINGYRNLMTTTESYDPEWVLGALFFTLNDNWGGAGWAARAVPEYDRDGNVVRYLVDGYNVGLDIHPHFYNGGLLDVYGNAKDTLLDTFPGNRLALANPGFEYYDEAGEGTVGSEWNGRPTAPTGAYPAGGGASAYAVDLGRRHGGRASQRVALSAEDVARVWQDSPTGSVRPGTDYTASAWVRCRDLDGVAGISVQFMRSSGSPVGPAARSETVSGRCDWTRIQVTAPAPQGASSMRLSGIASGRSGVAWFDDFAACFGDSVYDGSVSGFVLDEDNLPIEGAIVATCGGGYAAETDEDGMFRLEWVTPSAYDFIAFAPGYGGQRVRAQVVPAAGHRVLGFQLPRIRAEAPAGVKVRDAGVPGTLHVTWLAPRIQPTGVALYRSDTPGQIGQLVHKGEWIGEYWDSDVADRVRYYYTVRAVYGSGESGDVGQSVGLSSPGKTVNVYNVTSDAQWTPSFRTRDYGQTFVPDVDGFVLEATATPGFGGGGGTEITFSIKQDGPKGARIGPSRAVRIAGDTTGSAVWSMGDVPVSAGRTYYLELSGADNYGAYRATDSYPDGQLYADGRPVPTRDVWSTITIGVAKGPAIRDITVIRTGASSAAVRWRTSAPADCRVEYGPTLDYDGVYQATPMTAEGEAQLDGLSPLSDYHVRIVARRAGLPQTASLDYLIPAPEGP